MPPGLRPPRHNNLLFVKAALEDPTIVGSGLFIRPGHDTALTGVLQIELSALATVGREILDSLIFRILNLRLDLIFV